MAKITFLGAGSSVFAKNVLGDCMFKPGLRDAHIALYDIDPKRLRESRLMLNTLNKNVNKGKATITAHHGKAQLRTALKGADFVVNAIQVGGYKPSTVIDFEVPKKYGLRQTIADTLGIGGIFRALRTIPVMMDFASAINKVCPDAWFLNYTNPMCILTAALLRHGDVQAVGLCHSVQSCVPGLIGNLGLEKKYPPGEIKWKIAGINHMAWLLEMSHNGKDIYPEVRKAAAAKNRKARRKNGEKHWDMVRFEIMRHFGYYVTESSEHNAEYMPYWIKSAAPELIDELNIPLDEYPRRCIRQIEGWEAQRKDIVTNKKLTHAPSHEYGASIMNAIATNEPFGFHGNVMNTGLIPNLPETACVEVQCVANRAGVHRCHAGVLPEQLAGLNRTNINVQLLTLEAAMTRRKDAIYHAAMLDPHTAAELTLDQIRSLCDDLIEAHGRMLPTYR